MRITSFIVFSLICSVSGLAQDKEKSISIVLNNNGIMADLLDSYSKMYNVHIPMVAPDLKESKFKFDLLGELQLKEKIHLTARLGFGSISTKGDDTAGPGSHAKSKQNVGSVSVGFLYKIEFEKLRLTTGLDIPFYLIGNYTLDSESKEPDNEHIYTLDIKGGFATGLTNSTTLRYMIGERTYLITSVTFGLIYSQFGGGPSLYSVDYVDPSRDDVIYDGDRGEAKTLSISKPDFSFGAGLKF